MAFAIAGVRSPPPQGVVAFGYGETANLVPHAPLWLYRAIAAGVAARASRQAFPPTHLALRVGRGSVTAGGE